MEISLKCVLVKVKPDRNDASISKCSDWRRVHVVTVNEYLATRDSTEMGELYNFLGLTVGLNINSKSSDEKREAYNCDITYSTNNELGFDYLRDNMVVYRHQMVQRPLNYAIVDEVDSILIDEARTPLIISGQAEKSTALYTRADNFVKRLKEEEDYKIDVQSKTISLTEAGIEKQKKHSVWITYTTLKILH